MYSSGSDVYTALVRDFSLNPDDYGLTVVPVEDGGGTLGGGDIAVVSPTVDDTTKAAAVTWIDWYYMQKLLDEDAAVLDAKTLAESDQAVGTPLLPVLDRETYEESLTWIEPYINVPRDQMTPFTDGIWEQTPVGEPKARPRRSTPCSTRWCRRCSPTRTPTSTPSSRRRTSTPRPCSTSRRRADAASRTSSPGRLAASADRAADRPAGGRPTKDPRMTLTTAPPPRSPCRPRLRADRARTAGATSQDQEPPHLGARRRPLDARLPRADAHRVHGLRWSPIVQSVIMSLQETNLLDPPTWVGLDNSRTC